jgi:hypothetical protein
VGTKSNSFEGGTNATGITVGNSGGASGDAFVQVNAGTGGTALYTTTTPAHGTLCGEFTQATAANFPVGPDHSDTAAADCACRFYMYITGYPSATVQFPIRLATTADGGVCRVQMGTTGVLTMFNQAGTQAGSATSTVVPLNSWVRYELQVTGSGTASGTMALQTYLADSTTVMSGNSVAATGVSLTAGQIGRARAGRSSSATLAAFRVDDFVFVTGNAAPIGPFGGNTVLTFGTEIRVGV